MASSDRVGYRLVMASIEAETHRRRQGGACSTPASGSHGARRAVSGARRARRRSSRSSTSSISSSRCWALSWMFEVNSDRSASLTASSPTRAAKPRIAFMGSGARGSCSRGTRRGPRGPPEARPSAPRPDLELFSRALLRLDELRRPRVPGPRWGRARVFEPPCSRASMAGLRLSDGTLMVKDIWRQPTRSRARKAAALDQERIFISLRSESAAIRRSSATSRRPCCWSRPSVRATDPAWKSWSARRSRGHAPPRRRWLPR